MQFACKNIISPHSILLLLFFVLKCKREKKKVSLMLSSPFGIQLNWVFNHNNKYFIKSNFIMCSRAPFYLQLLLIFRSACEIKKWATVNRMASNEWNQCTNAKRKYLLIQALFHWMINIKRARTIINAFAFTFESINDRLHRIGTVNFMCSRAHARHWWTKHIRVRQFNFHFFFSFDAIRTNFIQQCAVRVPISI